MGPFYCKKRLPNSVQRTSTSFKSTHLFSPVSKTRTGRRGQQSPPKEGSGGNNSGISRILFKNISGSKEKRKTQIDYRSFNSESLCSYSKFQNGDSEKGQKLHSSQRLGIFVRSDGCLFACPYSSNVSQISLLHSKQQDISIQSSPIRVVNQSFCIHSTNDGNSFTSTHQSYFPLSLSRRLAVKEPKSSSSVTTQTINHPPDLSFRPYNKSGQIRSNSITGLCFHRDGISHPTKCSESSERQSSSITSVDKFFPSTKTVTARQFLSLLGKLNAAADYVELGRLHLRPLQMSLLAQWRPHKLPLSHPIKISHNICHHLTWWNNPHIYNQGVPIRIPSHSHQLFTDASLSGWGAHLEPEGILFHGVWTQDQSQLHINLLEMMAISLALKQSLLHISQSTVLVSSDNTTVISYLSRQGGTHSPNLCLEVWNLLNWCLQNRIRLTIRHIPGKFNILADRLSRINKPISTEWSLNQKIANAIFHMTNFPNIDLFATRLNHRLPLYVSPIPDEKALAIDAFTMNWNHIHAYAFPPFHLIPSVLNKIRQSQCRIVLVAPLWPNRSWFPELLNLLVSQPICLPVSPDLLEQLQGKFLHQNTQLLALHAWELSNNPLEIRSFQEKLQIMSLRQDELPRDRSIRPRARYGLPPPPGGVL